MQGSTSLLDFAAARDKTPIRKCATCNLPKDIRAEVDAALRAGVGHKVIGDWLRDVKKIDTKPTNYHFKSNHHLETPSD